MLRRIIQPAINHFRKPIYFYSRPWLLIGLNIALSALIMIFYEPFGYRFDSWAECTQLIGFSVIAFFSSVLFFLCLPEEPHIKAWMKHWTVGKNCMYSLLFLLATGLAISFYDFHLIMQRSAKDYGSHIFYICLLRDTVGTITIGVVPLCVGLLLEHSHRLKQDLAEIRKIHNQESGIVAAKKNTTTDKGNQEDTPSSLHADKLLLTGDTKESLEVDPHQILYLEASGNYVNVFYLQEKHARKILRTTFKNMEEQLTKYPFLVKCHRTYIVNIDFVETINRNDQGYHLNLTGYDKEIPVSRTYLKDFRKIMNS